MPYSLITSSNSPTGVNSATTASMDTTGADLLVVAFSRIASATPTITDSKSNTWTLIPGYANGFVGIALAYCRGGAVGTGHTFTVSGATMHGTLCAAAFSGSALSPLDAATGTGTGGYGNPQPGSITPSMDGCLVLTAVGTKDQTIHFTIDEGFSELCDVASSDDGRGLGFAYRIQSDAVATNPTYTAGYDGAVLMIAAFKPLASSSSLAGSAAATSAATGVLTHGVPLAGGAAGAATAAGNLSVTHFGIITTPPLKNNAGTVLANETGSTVHVYSMAGGLIVSKTGQTTDASGVMQVTDPALVAAVEYRGVVVLASGAAGLFKLTSA